MMTVYFDTCALNRLTDNLSQPRVLAEAEAVLHALELIAASQVAWLISEFVRIEIARNPDAIKRAQTLPLLDMASGQIKTTPEILRQAHALQAEGFDPFDAMHLAACDESSIDCMLTVDDRLIRRASRRRKPSVTQVMNPVDWLQRRSTWPKP
jgi:predicted nucleic acid-binding protein